jgi:TonB family protein
MRTTTIVAMALALAACEKAKEGTTPPEEGGEALVADEDEDYGDGAPVLVSDATEDITKGKVLGTTVETTGSLGPDEVTEVANAKMDDVGACYQASMERTRNQDLEGVVIVKFTIDKDGKVSSAEPGDSTLGDEEAGKCIAEAIKKWTFPKPPDGADVQVHFPFDLKSY